MKWKRQECEGYICAERKSWELAIGILDGGTREGDSFIAKALLKTLRKLPSLQVSDFVRRIPSPLQTFTDSSSYLVAPTSLFTIHCTMCGTTDKATTSLL
jgi:hypothetical protein